MLDIINLLLPVVLGMVTGIVIGLVPGVGIWAVLVLLFPFIKFFDFWQIIGIWLGTCIGSQYFGSVATLLLKVPGENSSLVFLNDVDKLTVQDRLQLIKETAYGSFFASMISLVLMFLLLHFAVDAFSILSSYKIRAATYIVLFSVLILVDKNKLTTAALVVIGVLLAEKTDYTLPTWVFKIQEVTTDLTTLSLMLGLLIIPEIFTRSGTSKPLSLDSGIKFKPITLSAVKQMCIGALVGLLGGTVPGQSATFSSVIAYNANKETIKNRIIRSESADNSAVLIGILPLIMLGVPITIDAVLLTNILSIKLIQLPDGVTTNLNLLVPGSAIDLILYFILFFSVIFFVLSQTFLTFYVKVVSCITTHNKIVFLLLSSWMIWVDHIIQPIGSYYWIFLSLVSLLGIFLKRKNINTIPLILGFILGDQIYWSFSYFLH